MHFIRALALALSIFTAAGGMAVAVAAAVAHPASHVQAAGPDLHYHT